MREAPKNGSCALAVVAAVGLSGIAAGPNASVRMYENGELEAESASAA
jgi:hypothetical protein